MHSYEQIPVDWFSRRRRLRTSHYPPPMSQPVSKNFNRISDFIFPDTVHIRFPQRQHQYHTKESFYVPRFNQNTHNQCDLIIVERLPAEKIDNVDLLYREQNCQSNGQIRRRYSSIVDERRTTLNQKNSTGLTSRSIANREKIRDRRKRHTTDNAYHSMLKTMVQDEKGQQQQKNSRDSNVILSSKTKFVPKTDSESTTSIQQQKHYTNGIPYSRVPINGTIPVINEYERSRQRQRRSSVSSQDSSTDTDIFERHPIPMHHYREDLSNTYSTNIWERLPQESDRFIPIIPSSKDINNQETMFYSDKLIKTSSFDDDNYYQINNQTSLQDSTHHVSTNVNDLHAALFIDEDTLNSRTTTTTTTTTINVESNDKTTHVEKQNTSINDSIVSTDYSRKRNVNTNHQSLDINDENKLVQPYFLIRPQTLLMLPNETAKFKCCFGGEPLPTIVWSHNESRIPEILVAGCASSTRHRTYKLHDIHYMEIGPVEINDNGRIKCTIMNRFGREEAIAHLLVVSTPADGSPSITQPLNDIIVKEGQPLKLTCGINGLQITVNWFHNGKLVSPALPTKSDYNDEHSIFTLTGCMKTDSGTIDCFIKNRFGEARTSCRIEVVDNSD